MMPNPYEKTHLYFDKEIYLDPYIVKYFQLRFHLGEALQIMQRKTWSPVTEISIKKVSFWREQINSY